MIAFLKGKLAEALPTQVTVDVNGVGYQVFVPLSTFDGLGQIGAEVMVLTHFHVRENDQALYGFATGEERDLFRLLIGRVSGVGPKVALGVLSGMAVSEFKAAVVREDIGALSQIKGLGKKTAERIVLELKDKVGVTEAWSDSAKGAGGWGGAWAERCGGGVDRAGVQAGGGGESGGCRGEIGRGEGGWGTGGSVAGGVCGSCSDSIVDLGLRNADRECLGSEF